MARHPHGWKANGREYVRKGKLIREFVRGLVDAGEPVTHSAVTTMLERERPGHRTFPTEISRALLGAAPAGTRRRGGMRVEADGAAYPSLAAAGEAHGISREAARKRVQSPRYPGWQALD